MLDQRVGRSDRSEKGSAAKRFLEKARDHRAAGRNDRARDSLTTILGAEPNHPDAHYELGQLLAANAPEKAVTHFITALRGAPEKPAYWLALAAALLACERLPDARAILEQFKAHSFGAGALMLSKAFIERTFVAAQSRYDLGKFRDAESLIDLILLLDEHHAQATYLAGAVAARTNRPELAFDLISIALYREPNNALFFSGLSSLLSNRGDHDGAISALEKALEFDPDLAMAHANIAGVYQRRFRYSEALQHAERAIIIEPSNAGAHSNRGSALLALGRLGEAVEAFDRALALDPGKLFVASNRLFAKLYSADVPPEDYAADAREFGRRYADQFLRSRSFAHERDPDRRLRIGYVSGDFCNHALVRFFEPYLCAIDRDHFDVLAYMTHAGEDAVSDRLRPFFDVWHNIAGLDDDEAADLIERDAIDILVDLSGHSAGNRLMLFARKPAPIQATWIGHPGTTGLTAIDYRITDTIIDPPGSAERLHTERLWRLPLVSATYACVENLPPVLAQSPFEGLGYVTFGCFNRLTKISDGALRTWARILAAVPGAHLFMVVGDIDSPAVRAAVEERLAEVGMPLDRVIFQPRVNSGYHELYHRVDIALDPYPYNGGTTSYDTLSMGVPFVTLRGGHAAARTGVAVLTAMNLPELIADTEDAYVAIARDLACDRDRLRTIRNGLRDRMFASPLMDHAGFSADLGIAFRQMWQSWLAEDAHRLGNDLPAHD
ncbi:tetratricopeptide repeat protein [Methylobacterium sp. WL18]|uniref:tetratricopeptide repeat protein n=1 Tax=Methylobacterium sp. WL18 TaxID=2603897 RepID=UPI0011CA563C|nr:tetratricopeptide repeat protein [Methylobacterium sp. WL18]TXN73854.1 tetratricopeptide repeat protein [Methylobacterium sp. WL18]